MDTWIVFPFRLLWLMLLWTLVYKYLSLLYAFLFIHVIVLICVLRCGSDGGEEAVMEEKRCRDVPSLIPGLRSWLGQNWSFCTSLLHTSFVAVRPWLAPLSLSYACLPSNYLYLSIPEISKHAFWLNVKKYDTNNFFKRVLANINELHSNDRDSPQTIINDLKRDILDILGPTCTYFELHWCHLCLLHSWGFQ